MGEGKSLFPACIPLLCARGAGEGDHCLWCSAVSSPAPILEWKWCWRSKDSIPFHLWNKHVVSSCWKFLGCRWPREPEFALPVLFFLLQVLQCSYTVIKMWNLCTWSCNEMSCLIDVGAVTIQARLKVTTTHLTVWKFSIYLCCPLAVGHLPLLDFGSSSLWSRYHTFCSFTLLHFEFLMEK